MVDSANRPIPGARVAAIAPAGPITAQNTDDYGRFSLYVSPLYENVVLRATADGYATAVAPMAASRIELKHSGSAAAGIAGLDLRSRNEPQAYDLLREAPGAVFEGSALFLRGGDPRYVRTTLNGVDVNGIRSGGLFDFSSIPSDALSAIEMQAGPLPGAYAMAGAVNFVTRSPDDGPSLDVVAEGGTHEENRFSIAGSGAPRRWGIAGALSTLNSNGAAMDLHNDDGLLSVSRRWHTQAVYAFGNLDWNESGGAIRDKHDTSVYGAHYRNDLADSLRLDVFTGFFLDNEGYRTAAGILPNKDLRASAEGRGTWAISKRWTLDGGYVIDREETRDPGFAYRRDDSGIFLDNRISFGSLSLNATLREQMFAAPGRTDRVFEPRLAGAWQAQPNLRVHGSAGESARPPGGAELAFANGAALRPQRAIGYDIGIERRVFNNLSLDFTLFRSRYKDLILPGSRQAGSARAQGLELAARFRPRTWVSLTANYTWLATDMGGIPLSGRPKQSGSGVATLHRGAFDVNLVGVFRGAAAGSVASAGYRTFGLNVNYHLHAHTTLYANLRNALDVRYEEVPGYPAPLVNVVAGVKWNLVRSR